MQEEKRVVRKAHSIIIEDRNTAIVSGVEDVESFDEQEVILFTDLGTLTIKGIDLRINKLNVENGELAVEGNIDAIFYTNDSGKKNGGFMSKLFR